MNVREDVLGSPPGTGPYMVKKIFFGTKRPMTLKICTQHRDFKYYQIYSNDGTGLTLSIFMIWSNLFPNSFAWLKAYTAYNHIFPSLF